MKKITLLLLFFIAFQSNAQVVASQNFDVAIGWTSTMVTNDANVSISAWSRRTAGTTPTCTPFAGAGMARFNSYNIPNGSSGRLTSPAITFAGASYRVNLKMFRDSGYPTDADNIKVYYNTTNAAGGTLLGTVNRSKSLAPIATADGWYTYTFIIPGTTTGTGYINILGTSAYGNNIFIDEIVVDQMQMLGGRDGGGRARDGVVVGIRDSDHRLGSQDRSRRAAHRLGVDQQLGRRAGHHGKGARSSAGRHRRSRRYRLDHMRGA